jgi:hypothetical protein
MTLLQCNLSQSHHHACNDSAPASEYPFKAYQLCDATTSLTFNNCTFCPHCIYVFCIYLKTNSDLCHLQHKLIGFYKWAEKCLQYGTDWVFKYSSLCFVCEGLNLNKMSINRTALLSFYIMLSISLSNKLPIFMCHMCFIQQTNPQEGCCASHYQFYTSTIFLHCISVSCAWLSIKSDISACYTNSI